MPPEEAIPISWPHAGEVTVDSYTSPVGLITPGEAGTLADTTGTPAIIYSDRTRSLTLSTSGQVKLDGNGNLSGVFTEPGRYRLTMGTSLVDITVQPDVDDIAAMAGFPLATITAWAPSTAYVAGQVVTFAGSTYAAKTNFTSGATFNAANWNVIASGGVGSTAATTVTGPDAFGASSVVGTSTAFARQDHDHGLPAAPTIPTAATSVTGPDAFGATATTGTSAAYARQDHDHGLPANPSPTAASSVTGPDAYGATTAVGTSAAYARADHDHGLVADPRGLPLSGTGIAGATAATRFAGATTSGPPSTGTFAIGDMVSDQTGALWICTAAPLTFAAVGGVRGNAPLIVVSAVATASVTLSGLAQTVDGVAINTAGMTVLATAQTPASQNGPWVAQSASWVRPAWFSHGSLQPPLAVLTSTVGTTNHVTLWALQGTASVTVDTDAQTWQKVSLGGGASSAVRGSFTGTGSATTFTVTHNLGLPSPFTCNPRFYYASPVNAADAEVVPQIGTLATNSFVATFPEAPANGVVVNWTVLG